MKYINIIFAIIFCFLFFGCDSILFVTDDYTTYKTVSIYGKTVEDIIRTFGPNEYPKQIRIKNNTKYYGTVLYGHYGEFLIKNHQNEDIFFYLDTKAKMGPVENIFFYKLTFSKDSLKGIFEEAGPLIDSAPVPFESVVVGKNN